MEKLVINDTADYFIKIIQPKLQRLKEQDPFDDYKYKTVRYYDKKVWKVLDIDVKNVDESARVARARAFSLAKQKIFFNKDLQQLLTLTYKENMQDYEKLKHDVKIFLKAESRLGNNPKYIWVVEKQKRGALHVHMIVNNFVTTKVNKNGHFSAVNWPHGFSSILDIKGADVNFKPYLYLFKYMKKSEKIGGRYVHSSRNLTNFTVLDDFKFNELEKHLVLTESSIMGSIDRHIIRRYYSNSK